MEEYLFDTHFHLDLQKDRTAAIREIEGKQLYTIAVTNLPDLYRKESAEIASKYIRFALGFHPELVLKYKKQIPLMWELLPEARYVGEVGLDFVDKTYEDEQISFFNELVERCRLDSNKIITIHSRQAVKTVLKILGKDFKFKVILHWFTGNKDELFEAIDSGCFFSINGAMTHSKRFLSMLSNIPSDRILLETDSPFTYFNHTHSETLLQIKRELKFYKPDLDVWGNFGKLLGG